MSRKHSLALALALCVTVTAPAALAFAEDAPAEEQHGGAHGGHGGPLTLDGILHGEERFSFFASIENFIFLVLVLWFFGRGPVGAFLNKRRDELEQGIKEASEAKAKAEARYREYSERLERLDDELKKLRADIETSAKTERERILADAQASAVRADADTRTLIELQAKQLGADVRRELVAAAVEGAQQALQSALKADDHKRLADGYVKAMGAIKKQENRA